MNRLLLATVALTGQVALTLAGNTPDYCYDDPLYVWQGKDCYEIAHADKCDVVLGNGDKIGEIYCPVSCEMCHEKYEDSYLMASKDCFEYGEDIVASFANVDPHKRDAIAIWPYDEEHPVHYSTSPILWKWLCYGDGENCLSYYGEIVMNGYASGEWPLSKGSYIMILKRGGTVCCVWSGEVEIETYLIYFTSIQVLTKESQLH